MARTVAVDFDGVIHSYERGWADGTIYGDFLPGAFETLLLLVDRYAVVVHTTRSPRKVARWIERVSGHNIDAKPNRLPWRRFWNEKGILLVTRRKLPAVAYIDDRAIRFESWGQALADLDKHENSPKET